MSSTFRHLVAFLILGFTLSALAQNVLSVRGSVFDPTGAAISGATVRLETPTGTLLTQSQTDPKGDFILLNLPAGVFQLVVPAFSGFDSRTLDLHLTANVTGLKVTLPTQSISQQINVGADQALSTDSSPHPHPHPVTGKDLRKPPVFDQDYVATLTPFLDPSSGSSGGLILIVDGVEMKSVGVSASAIQEVKINNDPYSAEFNRPGRGRIEIITKPGSPEFHGETNFIFRDAIFNAKNHFALVRPPEVRRIYEGHLSGPIGHGGHTSFIASASRREQDTAAIVHALGPNGVINENVSTPNNNTQVSLRVTHDFSSTHRLSLGYNFQQSNSVNAGVGGIT